MLISRMNLNELHDFIVKMTARHHNGKLSRSGANRLEWAINRFASMTNMPENEIKRLARREAAEEAA